MIVKKRLDLVVTTGNEIGSLEDNNVKELSFLREFWSVVLKLGRRYYSTRLNDKGGRDEESKSWGKRDIVSEGEDNAELVYDNDPLRWDDVTVYDE